MASIEEFENMLSGFGQSLNNIDLQLLNVSGPIIDRMKKKSPVKTGALKKSISAIVTKNTLTFNMLFYGPFQNYGVNGTETLTAKEVQFGVEPRPTSEPFYAFKKRRFGIIHRDFFDVNDITDEVANYLGDQLIIKINNTI